MKYYPQHITVTEIYNWVGFNYSFPVKHLEALEIITAARNFSYRVLHFVEDGVLVQYEPGKE